MRLGCHLAELGTVDDGKDPEVAADGGDLVTVTACGVLSSSNGHQNIRTSEHQKIRTLENQKIRIPYVRVIS